MFKPIYICYCEPTTLAVLGTVSSVSGTGLEAYGQYQQGMATAAEAEFQGGVAANNVRAIEAQKDSIKRAGKRSSSQAEIAAIRFAAKQVTAIVGSGVGVAGGTGAEIIQQSARAGAQRIIDVELDTANKIWGLDVEQTSQIAKGKLLKSKAKTAERLALISATSTLLSGAGQTALKLGSAG